MESVNPFLAFLSSVMAERGDPDVVLPWTQLGVWCVPLNVPLFCACVERQRKRSCHASSGEPEESQLSQCRISPVLSRHRRLFPEHSFSEQGSSAPHGLLQ